MSIADKLPSVKDSKTQSAVLQRFGSGLLRVSLNDSLGRAPDVLNSRPEKTAFARAECAVIALPCVKKTGEAHFFATAAPLFECFLVTEKMPKVYVAMCGSGQGVRERSGVRRVAERAWCCQHRRRLRGALARGRVRWGDPDAGWVSL